MTTLTKSTDVLCPTCCAGVGEPCEGGTTHVGRSTAAGMQTRRNNARRRANPARSLDVELRVRAFAAGFVEGTAGAASGRRNRRTVVDPATHEHWRRGFEDGKAALDDAADKYRERLFTALEQTTNTKDEP